jgi:hypothetical protein
MKIERRDRIDGLLFERTTALAAATKIPTSPHYDVSPFDGGATAPRDRLQFALKTMAPLSGNEIIAEPTNRRDQNWLSHLIACALPSKPAPEPAAIRESIGTGATPGKEHVDGAASPRLPSGGAPLHAPPSAVGAPSVAV